MMNEQEESALFEKAVSIGVAASAIYILLILNLILGYSHNGIEGAINQLIMFVYGLTLILFTIGSAFLVGYLSVVVVVTVGKFNIWRRKS
jgi:hypothetical protein